MNQEQTAQVLADVLAERARQDAKWGEQNHRDGTGPYCLPNLTRTSASASWAKAQCDSAFRNGRGTYAHILYEEVAEALEELDPSRLRAELVQVAAVAVAWIEKLDREKAAVAAVKEGA